MDPTLLLLLLLDAWPFCSWQWQWVCSVVSTAVRSVGFSASWFRKAAGHEQVHVTHSIANHCESTGTLVLQGRDTDSLRALLVLALARCSQEALVPSPGSCSWGWPGPSPGMPSPGPMMNVHGITQALSGHMGKTLCTETVGLLPCSPDTVQLGCIAGEAAVHLLLTLLWTRPALFLFLVCSLRRACLPALPAAPPTTSESVRALERVIRSPLFVTIYRDIRLDPIPTGCGTSLSDSSAGRAASSVLFSDGGSLPPCSHAQVAHSLHLRILGLQGVAQVTTGVQPSKLAGWTPPSCQSFSVCTTKSLSNRFLPKSARHQCT